MRISTSQIYERGTSNMLEQQQRAMKLQEQLSSGLRVQSPSDDPIAAAQIELVNQRLSIMSLQKRNIQDLTGSFNFQEGVLSSVVSTIQSLRTIQLQAGNDSISANDRRTLAAEAQNQLDQLLASANTLDGSGNYLYSGSKGNVIPFSKTFDNTLNTFVYSYAGDNTQSFQGISDNVQVAINDPGDNVFMAIPAANGYFTVKQPVTPNTGTAEASLGTVDLSAPYVPGDYRVRFEDDGAGGVDVRVTDTTGATTYYGPSAYQADAPITFNGISLTLSGAPAIGDVLIVESGDQSIFSTIQRMIDRLNGPNSTDADRAATRTENAQLLSQLDNALTNILTYQSDLGSRLNQLESVNETNNNLELISQEILKRLSEIDTVSVAVQYNLQLVNLQAAQQSFVKIQGLSVFNYIN
jgi:flagellar hook-associated protein 3 FlgL